LECLRVETQPVSKVWLDAQDTWPSDLTEWLTLNKATWTMI